MLISKATKEANYNADLVVRKIDNPENATLQITDTKFYVPVVTLSKENDTKLSKELKFGFKKLFNGTNIDHKCLFKVTIKT